MRPTLTIIDAYRCAFAERAQRRQSRGRGDEKHTDAGTDPVSWTRTPPKPTGTGLAHAPIFDLASERQLGTVSFETARTRFCDALNKAASRCRLSDSRRLATEYSMKSRRWFSVQARGCIIEDSGDSRRNIEVGGCRRKRLPHGLQQWCDRTSEIGGQFLGTTITGLSRRIRTA